MQEPVSDELMEVLPVDQAPLLTYAQLPFDIAYVCHIEQVASLGPGPAEAISA